jgi:hypothetical protein
LGGAALTFAVAAAHHLDVAELRQLLNDMRAAQGMGVD